MQVPVVTGIDDQAVQEPSPPSGKRMLTASSLKKRIPNILLVGIRRVWILKYSLEAYSAKGTRRDKGRSLIPFLLFSQ
ncbi:MAG TPA: hypothetical protein VN426_18210 [Syntrophomonadaceae bacterium]|nr:hypothetical protein [Syntrophomonadaceae bacterium]